MADFVVCGGGVIGLATAMMLAADDHDVTVLESDPSPVPPPEKAWDDWDRRGIAQFRQPHNLMAAARGVLDAELPGMTAALLAAGCVWVDPLAMCPPSLAQDPRRPGDDRLRSITGRRPVVESVFAQQAQAVPRVSIRRGVRVAGLLTTGTHVEGVVVDSGEQLRADLVIDAMGRRSKLSEWLVAAGAREPVLESEDSGFSYYSRFFTGPKLPRTIGPPAADLGTISILTIPGDNDTWSITVWCASSDVALRGLRNADTFTAVVAACPMQAHWLAGTPITDVLPMSGVLDRFRRFVVDGQPVATGVVAVGDAWGCTNPSAGRGVSVGLLHAQRLREVVRENLDPDAQARRFDDLTERHIAPFNRDQIAVDRARLAEMAALRDGAELAGNPGSAAVGAAMMRDGDVFRGLLETVHCLALPREVFARPAVRAAVAAAEGQQGMSLPAPTRSELLALVG